MNKAADELKEVVSELIFLLRDLLSKLVKLAIVSAVVMLLWNNVLIDIFDITDINYWQALSLRILFRGLLGNMSKKNK